MSESETSQGDRRAGERRADHLLTATEVASILQVTPAWIYAQTRRNGMPHVRLGRYVRYRRDTIEGWLDRLESS